MKHAYSLFFLIALLCSCTKKENIKKEEKGNLFYDKAYDYREAKKVDSAFAYFYKAKDLFLQQKDSLGAGKCLINMAILSADRGDNFGSQELSLDAIAYVNKDRKENFPYLRSNFNSLGITSSNLKNYAKAISFYKESLKYAEDSSSVWTIENNIANYYRKEKAYQTSIDIYTRILKKKPKEKLFAKVLSNFAYTKWKQNPDYDPRPDLLKALAIRKKENDMKDLTTSYDHLSEYYRKKKIDSALFYARLMYDAASMVKEPDDQMEALQKLIMLSPPEETRKYFEMYHQLDDSLKTARMAAKNQFALIRYDADKSKAENLKLQKENTDKKYKIARQEISMVIVLLTVAAIAVISILWYKKRKQKMELEAESLVHENQLRTSKKVHDVVANGLYRVMKGIDSHEKVDKGQLLDEIEALYEKSRDISYDPPTVKKSAKKRGAGLEQAIAIDQNVTHIVNDDDLDFHIKIADLLSYFSSEACLISIINNEPDIWEKTSSKVRYEVEHILQELMVNMSKHSKATRVVVKFEMRENWIYIHYSDNGVGMRDGAKHNNGLRNTGNRIEDIRGAITFDTQAEKGLKIQISFPIS